MSSKVFRHLEKKKRGEGGNRTALNGKNQISGSNQKHVGNFLLSLALLKRETENTSRCNLFVFTNRGTKLLAGPQVLTLYTSKQS